MTTSELPPLECIQNQDRFLKKVKPFFLYNGELYRRTTQESPRHVIIDQSQKEKILYQAHDKLGHKGEQAVFELIQLRFYWPSLRADVHFYIASCHECQIRNTKLFKMPYEISAPIRIFEKVYIDLMKMPKCAGYEFIIAAKDDLTGVTEARALRNKSSANLAKFFLEQIYYRYGAIGRVVTDNGSELEGAFADVIK